MKKNNNKGFLLTELLVTATLISTVLIFLYTQFYTIKRSYDNSFKYNTVNGLYALDNIRSFLIDNGNLYELKLILDTKAYIEINNSLITSNTTFFTKLLNDANIKKLYFTKENLDDLKEKLNSQASSELELLKRFVNNIDYDPNAADMYRLIAEFNDETFATLLMGGE